MIKMFMRLREAANFKLIRSATTVVLAFNNSPRNEKKDCKLNYEATKTKVYQITARRKDFLTKKFEERTN